LSYYFLLQIFNREVRGILLFLDFHFFIECSDNFFNILTIFNHFDFLTIFNHFDFFDNFGIFKNYFDIFS